MQADLMMTAICNNRPIFISPFNLITALDLTLHPLHHAAYLSLPLSLSLSSLSLSLCLSLSSLSPLSLSLSLSLSLTLSLSLSLYIYIYILYMQKAELFWYYIPVTVSFIVSCSARSVSNHQTGIKNISKST